ncbi:hypothetical protein H2248_007594 [Termitomyces sp. 'cryptogamus']|nr:hypothetical protein H2248_007594 [Termitomyces sp. 'cryptogamus']
MAAPRKLASSGMPSLVSSSPHHPWTSTVQIIGLSPDPVDKQKRFFEKEKLTYLVLSDVNGDAAKSYGIGEGLFGLAPLRASQSSLIRRASSETRWMQRSIMVLTQSLSLNGWTNWRRSMPQLISPRLVQLHRRSPSEFFDSTSM